jgi:hypothetical protein
MRLFLIGRLTRGTLSYVKILLSTILLFVVSDLHFSCFI